MKTESSNLSMAVTGSYSDTQTAPDSSNKRTIIGKGTATSECSEEFAGQEVMFMGVFPNATFAQAEQRLKDCGATTLIHLDGGGSSQFCSSEVEYSQFRDIPVNMGMKNAEIIIGGGEGSEL